MSWKKFNLNNTVNLGIPDQLYTILHRDMRLPIIQKVFFCTKGRPDKIFVACLKSPTSNFRKPTHEGDLSEDIAGGSEILNLSCELEETL